MSATNQNEMDFYATPKWCIEALIELIDFEARQTAHDNFGLND